MKNVGHGFWLYKALSGRSLSMIAFARAPLSSRVALIEMQWPRS